MIISCESCKSKFRLDPTRLKKLTNKVRCSRCGHVFMVSKKDYASREQDEILGPLGAEEDLLGDETMEEARVAAPFTPANIPLQPKRSSKTRLFLLGVLLLVALGGFAFWFLSTQTPRQMAGKPEAPSAKGEAVQPTVTILESTQAYFLENSPGGQVFVVQGEAINESSKPVSFVLLEGKLYTTRNEVSLSQRCYAGNVISKEDLTNLPITELQNRMMNREGVNLSNVHIAPGARVPFMLVFHNLPELNTLSDYSIEVLSAKID